MVLLLELEKDRNSVRSVATLRASDVGLHIRTSLRCRDLKLSI